MSAAGTGSDRPARLTNDLDTCYDPAPVAGSEPVRLGAIEFRALTLPALIAAKKATGRAKDRAQVIELEVLLALRRRG